MFNNAQDPELSLLQFEKSSCQKCPIHCNCNCRTKSYTEKKINWVPILFFSNTNTKILKFIDIIVEKN